MIRYACNICDEKFSGKQAFVRHSRKEHPGNGYALWNAAGTLGDAFADGAMERLSEMKQSDSVPNSEYRKVVDERDKAQQMANDLWKKLEAIKLIVR